MEERRHKGAGGLPHRVLDYLWPSATKRRSCPQRFGRVGQSARSRSVWTSRNLYLADFCSTPSVFGCGERAQAIFRSYVRFCDYASFSAFPAHHVSWASTAALRRQHGVSPTGDAPGVVNIIMSASPSSHISSGSSARIPSKSPNPASSAGVRKPAHTSIQKHTKSRTGCKTCKRRKVKVCDRSYHWQFTYHSV